MEIRRLEANEGMRLREIRLRALAEAPDAFGSTHDEAEARPPDSWAAQLRAIPTFVAVVDGEDVGIVRGARDDSHADAAWLISTTGSLPAPRSHIREHQRELRL